MEVKRMKKFVWVLMLVIATLGFSQEKYGVLTGKVTTDGKALPGVTMKLTGPSLMGQRAVVSDEKGTYRFNLIPAGQNYQLDATLSGFSPYVRKNIALPLGTTVTINVEMKGSSVAEEIVVTAEAPLVDTTTSSTATNVTSEFITKIGNDRQYQAVMSIMPGAIEGNNPYMLGGSDSDNVYMVDGADTTDPLTHTWGSALNFDTIDEVQVVTGGVSAEFGRGQGAVVNLVTKSGGNQFHGSVRFLTSKIDWNSGDAGKSFGDDPAASTKFTTENRWSLTLGGPIIKDKLWFFVAYETRDKKKASYHYSSIDDFLLQTSEAQTQITPSYSGHYFSIKLTYQLNENHSFQAFYSEDPISFPNAAYRNYTEYEDPFQVTQEQGGHVAYLEWNWVMSNDSFFTFKYQENSSPLNQVPVNDQWTTPQNPFMLYYTGVGWYYLSSNGVADTRYISTRKFNSVSATWSKFMDTSWGGHDLKVGLESRDSEYGSRSYAWNGGYRVEWYVDYDEVDYYQYHDDRPFATTYEKYKALFAQDKWSVTDRLTLNLGVRTEELKLENLNHQEVVKNSFGDTVSPRVGFAYDLDGDSIHGSFSRYYEATGNWVVTNSQPDQLYTRDNYYIWPIDLASGAYGQPWSNHNDWMAINPVDHPELWTFYRTNTYGNAGDAQILGSIKPAYMDEFTVGYEKQLSPNMSAGINLWHREWKDTYEDSDFDADGVWTFQTVKGKWREYKAVMLTLQKKLSDDGFQFLASYTFSSTKGYSTADNSTVYLDSVYDVYNWYGRLGTDHPHVLKFNGSYTTGGFTVGLNYQFLTGAAWAARMQVDDEIPGSGSSYQYPYYEKRGSRQLPSWSRADLHLEYQFNFKVWQAMSLTLYTDIFNVLNVRTPINVYNTIGFGHYDTTATPGTQAYTDYVTTHAPVMDEAYDTFGNVASYTMPRSYYFGASLKF
jgi:hypothetical protein